MGEGGKKRKKRKQKREKRSLLEHRHIWFRVLSYVLPYKSHLIGALSASCLTAFLGAFSILPMIPVIEYVLAPDKTELREEKIERSRDKDEAKADQIREARERGKEALDALSVRYPLITEMQYRISAEKDAVRARIYDFLDDEKENAVKWIVGILILATVFKAYFEYQAKFQITKIFCKSTQQLKIDLYASCLELDLTSLEKTTSGNLISRLSSDIAKVRTIIQSSLGQSILIPFQVIALFVLLLIIDAKITLITMIAVPAVVIPISLLGKVLKRMSKDDAEEDAYLVDVMQETLQGMQIVKAFAAEDAERHRFKEVARAQLKRQIRRMKLRLAAPAVVDVLTMAAMGAVIVVGAYVVIEAKAMSMAEFIVYLVVLTRFYKPLKGLSSGYVKVQQGLASAERVFEVIDTRPYVQEKPGATELKPIHDAITFEDVSFSYNGRDEALSNFTLRMQRGRRYALVGLSGAGKTTVARLLPRFYDPTKGRVAIDGVDLRDVTFRSLRGQIAVVTQETILFDTTIFANIAYGLPGATREQVESAARAANAHEFILELPQGYETRVGERGSQLSGGQRQRIAIARAILRNAPILILDEATSALDNKSEGLVQEALERLMTDRTTLVVAHRLSTVRNADCIVAMDHGHVVEQGTHDELVALGGLYAALARTDLRKSDPHAHEEDSAEASGLTPSHAST